MRLALLLLALAGACSPSACSPITPPTDHPLPDAAAAAKFVLNLYGSMGEVPAVYGVALDCDVPGGRGFTSPINHTCVVGTTVMGVGVFLALDPAHRLFSYGQVFPHEIKHWALEQTTGDGDADHSTAGVWGPGGEVERATAELAKKPDIDKWGPT